MQNILIPKIIHVSWPNKDIINSDHPFITKGIRRLKDMNPNWEFRIYDDNEVNEYVENLTKEDYHLFDKTAFVSKLDFWRLAKIYEEGGLYLDIDRLCNVELDSLLDISTKIILPSCKDFDFSQDIVFSSPKSPILLRAMQFHMERRREGHTNVFYLGPQTYFNAVTSFFIENNQYLDSDPGVEAFQQIRKTIDDIPFMSTYREVAPFDTLLYKLDEPEFDYQEIKKDFYKQQNVEHWCNFT